MNYRKNSIQKSRVVLSMARGGQRPRWRRPLDALFPTLPSPTPKQRTPPDSHPEQGEAANRTTAMTRIELVFHYSK